MTNVAKSLARAAEGHQAHIEALAATANQLQDGQQIRSGKRTFTRVTIAGDTFWKWEHRGRERHLTTEQMVVEAGATAVERHVG